MPYYTGIGSRRTPEVTLQAMARLAQLLARHGYTLRSGGADGADTAFEEGCRAAGGAMELWLPWKGFNQRGASQYLPTEAHHQLASTLHPAWERLSRGPKALHARNTGQVLGVDLKTPSGFVVCYTPDGAEAEHEVTRDTGGTGTAIRLASRNQIPVFNMARSDWWQRFKRFHAK